VHTHGAIVAAPLRCAKRGGRGRAADIDASKPAAGGKDKNMGFFERDWIDRLLGRRRTQARSGTVVDESAPAATDVDEIEEGATAARDEAISDRDRMPMPPPGTG
jgi:hypothetical protein